MGANQSQVVGVSLQPHHHGGNPFHNRMEDEQDLPPPSHCSIGNSFFGVQTLTPSAATQRPKRKVSDASTAITDFDSSPAILPASPKRSRIVTPSLATMPRQISRSITAALFPKIVSNEDNDDDYDSEKDENNDELIHQVLYDGLGQGVKPSLDSDEEPDVPRRALFPE